MIRRKQDLSIETNNLRKKHQRQIVLKDDKLNQNIKQTLALYVLIIFIAREKNEFRTRSNDNQNDENINVLRTRSKTNEIELNQDANTLNNDDENISNDFRTCLKNDDDSNHEKNISNDLRTRLKNDDSKDISNDL